MGIKVDLLGRTFGRLTVIHEAGRSSSGKVLWLCECQCGRMRTVVSNNLQTGASESCGSCSRIPDLLGKQFDAVKVIKYNGLIKHGNNNVASWLCEDINGFKKVMTTSSLNMRKNTNAIHKYTAEESAIMNVYVKYKSSAKTAKRIFALSFNEFRSLISKRCYYCNSEPTNNSRSNGLTSIIVKYNGLDRVDSSKGYTLDNIVPCCGDCNTMKLDMTTDEFFNKIKIIYNNFFGGGL